MECNNKNIEPTTEGHIG